MTEPVMRPTRQAWTVSPWPPSPNDWASAAPTLPAIVLAATYLTNTAILHLWLTVKF